eukprot:2601006-Rhodomonas_salina.1
MKFLNFGESSHWCKGRPSLTRPLSPVGRCVRPDDGLQPRAFWLATPPPQQLVDALSDPTGRRCSNLRSAIPQHHHHES